MIKIENVTACTKRVNNHIKTMLIGDEKSFNILHFSIFFMM